MNEYAEYDKEVTLFRVGSHVLRQKRGTFIGGRFSKQKTSLFLGPREAKYRKDQARQERDGFAVPDMSFHECFQLTRFTDDGDPDTFV